MAIIEGGITMSDVVQINGSLVKTSKRLAIASNKYTKACREAAEKRTDYDVQWAQELLKADGETVSERQANTTIVCRDAMREARIAEAERDALRERLRALQAVLNATQTRAAFLKEEMRLAGRDY
jgi:hypothetical protein